MNAPRKYIVTRSNFNEDRIGAYDSMEEAQDAAQQYADMHAEKMYIAWNADDGGTHCQVIESRATADEIETWAMNHADTYEEYFLPIARTTEKRYKKDRDAAIKHAQTKCQGMMQVAARRYDFDRHHYGGHFYRFTTDVQRQAAEQIAAYIIEELDLGNSWI